MRPPVMLRGGTVDRDYREAGSVKQSRCPKGDAEASPPLTAMLSYRHGATRSGDCCRRNNCRGCGNAGNKAGPWGASPGCGRPPPVWDSASPSVAPGGLPRIEQISDGPFSCRPLFVPNASQRATARRVRMARVVTHRRPSRFLRGLLAKAAFGDENLLQPSDFVRKKRGSRSKYGSSGGSARGRASLPLEGTTRLKGV